MARRRGMNFKIPGLGKLNFKSTNTWLLIGGLGLAGLYFLASTGRNTGVGFVDKAADVFEDYYEDYVGPLGPGGAPAGPMPAATPAPMVPGAAARGMAFDDMVFSGAYATDSPMPYTDWWNNDISDDDRIIVA
jgi:hypothetical protein